MNNIEEYDERIEKFLRGEMSPKEEAEFKDDVAANPELKERAKIISALVRGMKRKGEAEDRIVIDSSRKIGVVADIIQPTASKRKFGIVAIACSIAAVVLIMFNLTVLHSPSHDDQLFSDNYTPYSIESEVRGDEDSTTVAELSELFNSIGKKDDCSDVIKRLETIYASLDKDITYRSYANDVAWYLSLAYIKNDQSDKAVPVLEKLVQENPDTEIAEKAKKLIADIKKSK